MGMKKETESGLWTVFYSKRHPITRQSINLRRMGIKNQSEARRVLNELVLKVEDRIRRKSVPTWESLLLEFERTGLDRGLNPRTLENYLVCLRAHTMPDWANRTVEAITGADIRNLILQRLGQRTVDHQRSVLKFFRAVFQLAFEAGYVKQNPTPQMKFPKREKLQQVLTGAEAKRLLEQAKVTNSEWYPVWVLALYTGMRNGELYALTWNKVNLESRQIKVDTSWNSKIGFKSTKSGEGRYLEIAPPLIPLLKELKLQSADEFVLPRIARWSKGEQARELRMFLEGMGLPRVRFHDLRATWATIMLSSGIEPIKVMKMGGWKDLKTMQFYVRKAGVDIKGITDKLVLHDPVSRSADIVQISSVSDRL